LEFRAARIDELEEIEAEEAVLKRQGERQASIETRDEARFWADTARYLEGREAGRLTPVFRCREG
jgi:hypothetical protein